MQGRANWGEKGSEILRMNFGWQLIVLVLGLLGLSFTASGGTESSFKGYIIKLKPTSVLARAFVQNGIQNLEFNRELVLKQIPSLRAYGEIKDVVNTSFGHYVEFSNQQILSTSEIRALAQDPQIEYIEPNFIIKIKETKKNSRPNPEYRPTDEHFYRQWGLANSGSEENDGVVAVQGEDLNMILAWGITTGSRSAPVKIAVIDTGIDYNHPELKSQMDVNLAELRGVEGVDDDHNGFVDDIYGYDFANKDGDPADGAGHGTHCAGIIGASHNGIGIAGVMANVKLIALKFLSDQGDGLELDAVRAIDYAIKRGAKVLSNSWGGTEDVRALEDAIEAANEAGVVFVAAAGNDQANNDKTPSYPANYKSDNLISVGSFDSSGSRSYFSNFGLSSVHVMGPGSDILSTYPNEAYEVLSGTSMATPHISGVVGLLLSQWPDLTPLEIRDHLIATSAKTWSLAQSSASGGRVDAYKALSFRPVKSQIGTKH